MTRNLSGGGARWGRAGAPPPQVQECGRDLPVELQCELDNSRVIGRVACCRDPAEIDVLEIQRSRSTDHGGSARRSQRSGEVRVIGQVKELGPEFRMGFFRCPKLLEE